MTEFDHGPAAQLAELFDRVPDPPVKDDFWFDWGPVFYRGRLDGSARVLCVASDPGPTERIAGRTLVGNAGQRVQGFLAKLGLTRSYVCVNAWAYAVHPSRAFPERDRLDDHDQLEWRNELYDAMDCWTPLPVRRHAGRPGPDRGPARRARVQARLRVCAAGRAAGLAGLAQRSESLQRRDHRAPPRHIRRDVAAPLAI
jgi:hypothetical protein